MTPRIVLLAAGSLKGAFVPLLARFHQLTGIAVEAHFGPAGLLRERIEAGERCSVFASANGQHPQALRQAGLPARGGLFAAQRRIVNCGTIAVPPIDSNRPPSGASTPVSVSSSVLFPRPLAPRIAQTSPARQRRLSGANSG